jgi:RNA polymerase sigma-70 factor (ECF subfamily)
MPAKRQNEDAFMATVTIGGSTTSYQMGDVGHYPTNGTFERLRPRLQGIAYRMLESATEAEGVVQEVWQRWQVAAVSELDRAAAWLITTTIRQCLIRLRARNQDRQSAGESRPSNWMHSDSPATPEERADEISVAFLILLECLPYETRTAFLLSEMFDVSYDELAGLLHKSEADCRQLVSHAKKFLRSKRPPQSHPRDPHFRLLSRFAEALASADLLALAAMLAAEAELSGEGGNGFPRFNQPLHDAQRIAQLLVACSLRHGSALRIELAMANGRWELMFFVNGEADSILSCEIDLDLIAHIHLRRSS